MKSENKILTMNLVRCMWLIGKTGGGIEAPHKIENVHVTLRK